jgi:hypothetical protein
LYSEPQPPSRADAAPPRRGRRRALWWILGIVAFLAASIYVVGGPELMRNMLRRGRQARAQATAALQPPSQAEVQAASPQDTATAPPTGIPPVTIGTMAMWIGGILLIAVALFYYTGRDSRKRRRA